MGGHAGRENLAERDDVCWEWHKPNRFGSWIASRNDRPGGGGVAVASSNDWEEIEERQMRGATSRVNVVFRLASDRFAKKREGSQRKIVIGGVELVDGAVGSDYLHSWLVSRRIGTGLRAFRKALVASCARWKVEFFG